MHKPNTLIPEKFSGRTGTVQRNKNAQTSAKDTRPIVLKNIFFLALLPTLLPASQAEIQALAAMLKEQTELHIRITGHLQTM